VFASTRSLNEHKKRKYPCKEINKDVTLKNTINVDSQLDEVITGDVHFDELEKFNIGDMFKDKQEAIAVIIAGSRQSGKTTFINYIYPNLIEFYDIVIFFSYSLHNPIYENIQEPKFDKFIPDLMKDIFYFQKKTKNKFSIMVVLDDCMDNEIKNDDQLNYIFTRGRNSNISVIFSVQYMSMVKNLSRSNSTFIFFGKSNTPSNRLVLAEDYLYPIVKVDSSIKTKTKKLDYLDAYIQHHTQDHNFIVIDYMKPKEEIYNFKVPL
jgi:hypothetical protein